MVSEIGRKARMLTRAMPQPEIWLWNRLKRLREHGYRFRRQHPHHAYFFEFVCLDRMLVIEVDGGQHSEPVQCEHDALRDRILARGGFEVLRFWNGAVRNDIDGVMDKIVRALEARPSVRGRAGRAEPPGLDAASPP